MHMVSLLCKELSDYGFWNHMLPSDASYPCIIGHGETWEISLVKLTATITGREMSLRSRAVSSIPISAGV